MLALPIRAAFLLLVCWSALCASDAGAQGGYTTEKFPELGLSFPRARDYEQVPTQPDEPFVVLYFTQKSDKADPAQPRRATRPEMSVVWIDFVPDRVPTTGSGSPSPGDPPPVGDAPPAPEAAPKSAKPPINSIERWFEQRAPQWKIGRATDGKPRDGYTAREYELHPAAKNPSNRSAGWLYVYSTAARTIAIVGIAHEDDLKEHAKIWRHSAERMQIDEPQAQSSARLERLYARSTLKDPAFRIKVRQKLVRGWKAEDTENFIVIYNSTDQPMMRKVFRDLELIRKEYEKLFPAAKPIERVSAVRICKDRDEYMAYGGIENSAGYWNWSTEELVFYDAEVVSKDYQRNDDDTFIVLYHEAFHQYIHYSTGELPPHSWFNEGFGDYFSGATVRDGKMRSIGVNPWRIRTIQHAIEVEQFVPWSEIVRYEQSKYYESGKAQVCYAQGWSMIYFLRTSKDVQKRAEWAKILPTYFDTLKETYQASLAALAAAGKEGDQLARAKAGFEARTKAVDAAFEGVDMLEIQAAWASYTLSLPAPERKR